MLLLDGEIEAAAGAVVGAQNQHHIFVADSAAQGFFVTHQCHGMDGVQTLYQTFRVVLALIQSHEANHAPQDAGAEGVGVALPATRQHGQGFFVEVCTVGLVFLKGRADADNLPLCAVVVQPQLQAGTFGGIEKSNGLGILADQRSAKFCASGQRPGNACLFGKEDGFFLFCQPGVHLADDREVCTAVHGFSGHKGVLTIEHMKTATQSFFIVSMMALAATFGWVRTMNPE